MSWLWWPTPCWPSSLMECCAYRFSTWNRSGKSFQGRQARLVEQEPCFLVAAYLVLRLRRAGILTLPRLEVAVCCNAAAALSRCAVGTALLVAWKDEYGTGLDPGDRAGASRRCWPVPASRSAATNRRRIAILLDGEIVQESAIPADGRYATSDRVANCAGPDWPPIQRPHRHGFRLSGCLSLPRARRG